MNFTIRSVPRPKNKQRRPSSARIVFNGALFKVWCWEQKLPSGRISTFETLQRPDTVLVIPVLDDGRVILIEETQPGMKKKLNAIGGRVEPGELPEEAVKRELLEESGYEAQELRLWDAWQPVDKIDWAVYLYVAHGLKVATLKNSNPDELTKIRRVKVNDLLEGSPRLKIDDYELLHKLYYVRSDSKERRRVVKLLTPNTTRKKRKRQQNDSS